MAKQAKKPPTKPTKPPRPTYSIQDVHLVLSTKAAEDLMQTLIQTDIGDPDYNESIAAEIQAQLSRSDKKTK